ncbi:MAG: hypothetical protein IJK53_07625 [Erysipelotrichaceae bacterium]|nr:hypothetical protein [Erysipelotrichaceae bacterium]
MEKVRLGIIGCGVQGSLYAKLLLNENEKIRDIILTFVSSRSKEAMKDLPKRAYKAHEKSTVNRQCFLNTNRIKPDPCG